MTDAHLWADRFEGSLEDVFELAVTKSRLSVAGVIEPALQEGGNPLLHRMPPHLRSDRWRPLSPRVAADDRPGQGARAPGAGTSLREAIARDPNYGRALVGAACGGLVVGENGVEPVERIRATRETHIARRDPDEGSALSPLRPLRRRLALCGGNDTAFALLGIADADEVLITRKEFTSFEAERHHGGGQDRRDPSWQGGRARYGRCRKDIACC